MERATSLSNADLVRIAQAYYDAVDSHDPDRIAAAYLPGPTTTSQFNADAPIVTADAIREFSAKFSEIASGIRHTMIEVWTTPLMGDVVPVDLAAPRSDATVTVVSTALPIFTIGEGPEAQQIALPATSIFTIDFASGKFASVHNMFDIGKVYAALNS